MNINAVIYARYSSDNQREESIEGQLRECQDFADKHDMRLVGTYIDRAFSAKTDDRPDFQRMIKESEKKLFDAVIVWKLDRFSRDRYDSAHYKRILSKNGVKVVSATEPISDDSSGILLESVLEGMAEYYSAELSEKIHRGMKENVLNGKYNGQTLPLGLVVDADRHFAIDETTAPIVREIFEMYASGRQLQEIADLLNSKGLKTYRGNSYKVNTVSTLLHNRKYIGEYKHGEVINLDAIPPIVSVDLFDRVQSRFEQNRRAPAKRITHDECYYLTTKLFCGDCNTFMSGESGTGRNGIHRYYKCSNAKRKRGCKMKAVRKEWVENLVFTWVKELMMDDDNINALADMLVKIQEADNVAIPALQSELAETEKKITNVMSAIEQGVFTKTTKERLEELEARKQELTDSIATEEIRRVFIPRDFIIEFLLNFRNFDMGDHLQKQQVIDTFVNAVYVYSDRIVITLNYSDGARPITIKDLSGSSLTHSAPPKTL